MLKVDGIIPQRTITTFERMKPYEKYKDSGVEWIGEIPEHWTGTPLKHISSITKGKKAKEDFQDYSEGLIPYLSMEFLRNQTDSPIYVNPNDNSLVLVEEKDLLILWDGSKAGEIVKAKKGALSSTMGKIHINNVNFDIEFITYLLKYGEKFIQSNRIGMGIPHVDGEVLRGFLILKPTLQEQTAIANFLDHQTAIIDELIEKKTKQIALLKEKRQAIINETVTKGLDPTAKMKDSGVEWLGEIPKSWEVVRLRYLGKCQNGVSQGSEYFGSGDPFVNYSDVYKNISLPQSVSGLAKSTDADRENYSVIEGDIFFTRTSETIEEIGLSSVCLNTIDRAVFAGFLIRFRPIPNVLDKGFSKYYFRSHIPRVYFVKEMNLVTRASLSQELLKSLPVLLPSLEEQQVLAQFLDKQVEKMNSTILEIESAVQKLKEYRQSLISEAVTGKIDVRGWQSTV